MAGSEERIIIDRKDLAMRNRRNFSVEFKHQIVEEVYNRKRLHSALGYRPLNELKESLLIQLETMLSCRTLLTLPVQS